MNSVPIMKGMLQSKRQIVMFPSHSGDQLLFQVDIDGFNCMSKKPARLATLE